MFLPWFCIRSIQSVLLFQPIKRALDKRTVEVYTLFNEELNAVKKELTGKQLALPFNQPKFAGQAQWCRLLKKRIEREMMILDRAHFLPHMGMITQITQHKDLFILTHSFVLNCASILMKGRVLESKFSYLKLFELK